MPKTDITALNIVQYHKALLTWCIVQHLQDTGSDLNKLSVDHAAAIFASDYPNEVKEIIEPLKVELDDEEEAKPVEDQPEVEE